MNIYNEIAPLRTALWDIKKSDKSLALVPTMGNLHAGHLSLVKKAKECADKTLVSIFVNPLQFGPNEDFASYPRSLEADAEKLLGLDVDFIFAPADVLMYPYLNQKNTCVSLPGLSDELCGASRPGFFYGITTVLAKLFNIIQPEIAVFGEKDYQQLIIVRRMVEDLNFPIKILGMPIIRESDGLAMSSRNQYLSTEERGKANGLYHALCEACEKISADFKNYTSIINTAIQNLTKIGFKIDYISLRQDTKNLSAVDILDTNNKNKKFILLAAAFLGKTRLLDNIKFIA
jgi:pantoate--beta-alanine ligase